MTQLTDMKPAITKKKATGAIFTLAAVFFLVCVSFIHSFSVAMIWNMGHNSPTVQKTKAGPDVLINIKSRPTPHGYNYAANTTLEAVTIDSLIPARNQEESEKVNVSSASAVRLIKNRTIPSNLYYCGYDIRQLGKSLFPEFPEGALLLPRNYSSLQPQDVVLYGMYGRCHGTKYGGFRNKFVRSNFPAKILYANGEPFGNALENSRCPQNEYQIGGNVDKNDHGHIVGITFAAFTVASFAEAQRQMLFDPSRRPKNSGEHNAVSYINGNCVSFRQEAALNISAIVPIHFGGHCRVNTTNGVVKRRGEQSSWRSNWKIFSDYKYCLCMENSVAKHYVTEKIINAFMGGCLPIYYGTPESLDIFNVDSFIFYDINNPGSALDEIRYLESHPEAYARKFEQPILRNGSQTLEDYFSLSDSIGHGKLKGKIRAMLGFDQQETFSLGSFSPPSLSTPSLLTTH